MTILFINCLGGGFAQQLEIPAGTTVGTFFVQQMPHDKPSDFLIRVNRLPAPADQVLQPGDRLTFTPVKIEGAF